jgi:hypothetical protein
MNRKQMIPDLLVADETRDGQKEDGGLVSDPVLRIARVMPTGQVIERTKEWVRMQSERFPGFLGAHLMGGITSMAVSDPFPEYRDVDLHIILKDDTDIPGENAEALYKGLMIEAGFRRKTHYSSPEVVLADPVIASHMAVPSILSDPSGFLTRLHEVVAREYARRKWVLARCEAEKREAFGMLEFAATSRCDASLKIGAELISTKGCSGSSVSRKRVESKRSVTSRTLQKHSISRYR